LNVDVSVKASIVTGLYPAIGVYFEIKSDPTVLDDDTRWSINVRDHRSSGIRRFVMTHSVIYSTFHLLSRRIDGVAGDMLSPLSCYCADHSQLNQAP
jgi:hypothetical protein